MKSFKRIVTLLLAFVMMFSMAVPTFATSIHWITIGSELKITYESGIKGEKSKPKKYDLDDGEKSKTTITLFKNSDVSWEKKGYELTGWKIDGKTYDLGGKFTFDKREYELDSKEDQYALTAEAIWEEEGTATGEKAGKELTGTFKPGEADGTKFKETYKDEYKKEKGYFIVTFPKASKFDGNGMTFKGWELSGYDGNKLFQPGDQIALDVNFEAVAQWTNRKVIGGGDSSSSTGSGSSSSSSSASSKPSSSSSSAPASSSSSSSVPASSSSSSSVPAPSSSSSSVPAPSSSSSSVPASSSVPESSSEPEVPEQPEQPVEPKPQDDFKPVTLAYNINGDVPVSGIKFDVNEDIGGVPSLFVSVLEKDSSVDDTTADFISSGNALAAFDISMLCDGNNYSGPVNGVLTYELNGTQATEISNFEEHVLAMVHVISADKFDGGSYYMTDGKKVYLYDVASGSKSEVNNIGFVENDGVYRPVIADANALGTFAYQSKEGTIVVVKPLADENAASVSMDVTSFSPFMLVHLEKGEAGTKGGGFPIWLIIVIAVVVLAAAAVGAFFFLKNKGKKNKSDDAFDDLGEDSGANITGLDE